ncbi:tyrosine--tRNA ligase, mitochondrial-like isoform X1 [Homarus americanus]|uniref:tyrosine--tRNA ligase, mitochondrial-like isoform X1 n=2 Tax=Homarus americanus TaxID=6706 RepID=UPI001C4384AE|nr:tyrosine--tRNA ligase, mitochondrial-like isoform X1 [Homarus americanus]
MQMYPAIQTTRQTVLVGSSLRQAYHRLYLQLCRTYTSRNVLKLNERGLWADRFPDSNTNKLIEELTRQPQTVYSGFDPTADSLHVGNLLVLIALLHCQRAGHNIIALVGGATAQVGDPSGRSSERPQLKIDEIKANSIKISENIRQIFENHKQIFWDQGNDEPLPTLRIENNLHWYKRLNVVDFLRDAGRNLRMGDMLSRTSVQSRLSAPEGLSFTEFSYQALQAYDWLYLYDMYNCKFQIGGNDQMGNIYTGHQLIHRVRKTSVTGLTIPIITNESGDKFGKSAGNPIWLDSSKTSPFDLYQFFVRIKDSEVEKYLHLLTFLPVKDIKQVMEKHWGKPESRYAQKKLAEKVTLLVHGRRGLESARRTSEVLYGNQSEALAEMTRDEIQVVFNSYPSVELILTPGTSVLDLALKAQCFKDERDARRIIEAGGFYINLSRVSNPDLILVPGAHILPNGLSLLRVGKKNYYLIKWQK